MCRGIKMDERRDKEKERERERGLNELSIAASGYIVIIARPMSTTTFRHDDEREKLK